MPRFGQFAIDPAQHQLSRGGQPVHLTPKAFELLCLLIEAAPRVVTKTEIHGHLWPDTFVADATLTGLIKEIRRALDDRDRDAPILRTVHKIGYVFCPAIERREARVSRLCGWLIAGERRLPVVSGKNIVGRDPGVNIWLDFDTVSRRHACITARGDATWLEDLDSKNGTRVGGQVVAGKVTLGNGDRIQFGQIQVTWHRQSALPVTMSQASYVHLPASR
jgi:DNA-binding winged helix-turn-helix (wHTH) protein